MNNDVEQLGEDYLRLSALGAYGSFFNIYFCSVTIKINEGRPAATSCSRWAARWIPATEGALLPNSKRDRDPLRTGVFGLVLVLCVVLIAFGYSGLPFWPQGRTFDAYFADAAGITPGNAVYVSGIKVGKVSAVGLAGDTAKITFSVDRHVLVGDQSLAAIRTDTILGERSISVSPAGTGKATTIPLSRTTTPYTLAGALEDLGENASNLNKPQFEQALNVLTDTLHDATPDLRGALDGVTSLSRTLNRRDEALQSLLAHAKSVTSVLSDRSAQVNKLVDDGNELFAALDERREALSQLISGDQRSVTNRFRASSQTIARSSARPWTSSTWC